MYLKTYLCPPHFNICALSTPSYFCTSDVAHYVCSCFLGSLGLGWVFSFFLSFFREAPKTEYSSSKVLNNCIPHNHVAFFLQQHNLPFISSHTPFAIYSQPQIHFFSSAAYQAHPHLTFVLTTIPMYVQNFTYVFMAH